MSTNASFSDHLDADDQPRTPLVPVNLTDPWLDSAARAFAPMVLDCCERARDKSRRDSPLYPWRVIGEAGRQDFVYFLDRAGFETGMDEEWTRFDVFLTACLEGSPLEA